MNSIHPKGAFVYQQVRRSLQSGQYAPGQRVDPAKLAADFEISPTPVRFALYRLVGQGLLADHARSGFHVPFLNEVTLRDLYDWMERLLLMACELDIAAVELTTDPPLPGPQNEDVVKQTWQLFDTIARATGHRSLHQAVRHANDQLAPIRRAKQGLLEHLSEEFSELNRYWQTRNMPALMSALRKYHERRKDLVPHIVAVLSDRR